MRSPNEEIKSTGNALRSHRDSKPTIITPAEWPKPQRTPGIHAPFGRRTASGAIAVEWSGPVRTWTVPENIPVMAAIIVGEI